MEIISREPIVRLMTYGEARLFAKENSVIYKGEVTITTPKHEPRKSFVEACEYYNRKLQNYWKKNIRGNKDV